MFIECYHKIHKDQEVQGFLNYDSCAELEDIIIYNVSDVLEDNDIIYNDEIEYLCIYAHGSRVFGNPRKNSDIDFVLFYKGTIREDDLFNIFADENIYIEHIKCDFNPIEIDDKSDIEYYIQKHDVEYHQKPVLEKKINLALALDDFDDEEQVQNIKSKQNNHEDYTKNYLDAMEYFVDLGLPSGTLWCKYNLGVDYKKLVKNPENSIVDDWTGDFYAFAETETKPIINFTKEFYKYANYDPKTGKLKFTKYIDDVTKPNRVDKLEITDDPAYMNNPFKQYGINICLPTMEQCEELGSNIYKRIEKDYLGIKGLNVVICTSKINENEIIFPLNGIILDGKIEEFGKETHLMNSFVGKDTWHGYGLMLRESWMNNNQVDMRITGLVRQAGRNVRPVLMKK